MCTTYVPLRLAGIDFSVMLNLSLLNLNEPISAPHVRFRRNRSGYEVVVLCDLWTYNWSLSTDVGYFGITRNRDRWLVLVVLVLVCVVVS